VANHLTGVALPDCKLARDQHALAEEQLFVVVTQPECCILRHEIKAIHHRAYGLLNEAAPGLLPTEVRRCHQALVKRPCVSISSEWPNSLNIEEQSLSLTDSNMADPNGGNVLCVEVMAGPFFASNAALK